MISHEPVIHTRSAACHVSPLLGRIIRSVDPLYAGRWAWLGPGHMGFFGPNTGQVMHVPGPKGRPS